MDLESWIEIQDAEHRARMGSLLDPLSPIGFSGRSGVVFGWWFVWLSWLSWFWLVWFMCCCNLIIITIIIIINIILVVVVVVVVAAALWVLSPKGGEVVGWTVWAGWVVESPVGGAQLVKRHVGKKLGGTNSWIEEDEVPIQQ